MPITSGRRAAVLALLAAAGAGLAGCPTGGGLPPTQVIRYHLDQPIARGTVSIQQLAPGQASPGAPGTTTTIGMGDGMTPGYGAQPTPYGTASWMASDRGAASYSPYGSSGWHTHNSMDGLNVVGSGLAWN